MQRNISSIAEKDRNTEEKPIYLIMLKAKHGKVSLQLSAGMTCRHDPVIISDSRCRALCNIPVTVTDKAKAVNFKTKKAW